ncbi:MAG: PTS fructose transporter subunit IIB [Lachnospiraceae bacterium]|nr:PTS fructose transporter subunit IIB [Lachnospiraceae bacterium]
MKILAVTACPSGVAHTYIAAEAIQNACLKAGVECKVETQGALGVENAITPEDVRTADACILTTDIHIKDKERFESIPKVEIGVNVVIRQADMIITKMIKMLEKQKTNR